MDKATDRNTFSNIESISFYESQLTSSEFQDLPDKDLTKREILTVKDNHLSDVLKGLEFSSGMPIQKAPGHLVTLNISDGARLRAYLGAFGEDLTFPNKKGYYFFKKSLDYEKFDALVMQKLRNFYDSRKTN